jgi:hypothetical protein
MKFVSTSPESHNLQIRSSRGIFSYLPRSICSLWLKVQTIKLHSCNKYFKLYGCELLFTWAFVYSLHLIEIAIVID